MTDETYLAPYIITDPAKPIPQETFLLPICITPERFDKFWAALVQGGWTMFGQSVGDYNIDVLRALAYINDPNGGLCDFDATTPPNVEIVIKEVIKTVYANYPTIVYETIEDEMPSNLKIEYIGGRAYLEMDCGCGTSKYFSLSEAAVDPVTGAPATAGDVGKLPAAVETGLSAPVDNNGDLSTSGSCYVSGAADVLISAQIEFVQDIFGWTNTGVTVLTPTGAAYEVLQALSALRRGEFDFLSSPGITANDVVNTLRLVEWKTRLESAIEAQGAFGSLTRNDLSVITTKAMGYTFGAAVALSGFMAAWVQFANMTVLNERLAVVANGCESGLNIGGLDIGGSIIGEINTFKIIELTEYRGQQLAIFEGITTYLFTVPETALLIAMDITQTGGGGWGAQLNDESGAFYTWGNGSGFIAQSNDVRNLRALFDSVVADFGGGGTMTTDRDELIGEITALGLGNELHFSIDHVYIMIEEV